MEEPKWKRVKISVRNTLIQIFENKKDEFALTLILKKKKKKRSVVLLDLKKSFFSYRNDGDRGMLEESLKFKYKHNLNMDYKICAIYRAFNLMNSSCKASAQNYNSLT